MAERTAWRICTDNRWWSVFGKKRGKNGKTGPPIYDDLVERDFTADGPNRLWLSDIIEHRTEHAVDEPFGADAPGVGVDADDAPPVAAAHRIRGSEVGVGLWRTSVVGSLRRVRMTSPTATSCR
jgi:transposase InsO family protein